MSNLDQLDELNSASRDDSRDSAFPCGLLVVLRLNSSDGLLHRNPHPTGREIFFPSEYSNSLFQVLDSDQMILATYFSDSVACVVPLPPENLKAPSDANN